MHGPTIKGQQAWRWPAHMDKRMHHELHARNFPVDRQLREEYTAAAATQQPQQHADA